MKFVSNQPLGGSFLCSGIHTAPDRAPEGRGAWWGRHQGMAFNEQLWKSLYQWLDNSNISPLLWLQEPRQRTGEKVLQVGWGREGQGAEGCRWKQDRGYCARGEYPWKAWPSSWPEGVSSRPEDGNPVPSAFSPLTTLPCVT